MSDLFIGLMSGTSADGIDAALVDFANSKPVMIGTHYSPYSPDTRQKILSLCVKGENEIQRLGELDVSLGRDFATATNQLLKLTSVPATSVRAIGSHGQTVRHLPKGRWPFTLQIGDPNILAAETGITTVADFRRKDIALGGQGAPLVPAFHHFLFASKKTNRAIVNIGGIANVTILAEAKEDVFGFDTGPGNVLLDAWTYLHLQKTRDENGAWAAQGNVQPALLDVMLADNFFHLPFPKSTGREYFNLEWVQQQLQRLDENYSAVDVQATLTELTALSILNAIKPFYSSGEILICGGGVHNVFLLSRLRTLAGSTFNINSTLAYDFDPDWIEAAAFAWLARQTLNFHTGNLPKVTGSKQATILGGIYYSSAIPAVIT